MKASVIAALVVVGMAAGVLADEAADKALDAQQGTWSILTFSSDGNEVDQATLVTWQRIVKGHHVVWKQADETLVELDIRIDPSTKPMTLDSTIATGDSKGQTMLAIYEMKGDELRVCFAKPGDPRPAEFTSAAGSGLLIYTARRLSR